MESLEDEQKQLRYRTLNNNFKTAIEMMQDEFGSSCNFNEVAARDFFVEMNRVAEDEMNVYPLSEQLSTVDLRLKRLAALLKAKVIFKAAKVFRARLSALLSSADDSRLLLAWLLLSGMKPGALEQFGLDCTLRRMLGMDGATHRISLLSALLALPEVSTNPPHIFYATPSREFLAVHESRGTEWFNKECFEELGEWLAIIGLLEAGKPLLSAGAVSASMVKVEDELQYSRELAAHAGYRTSLYRRMLPGGSDQTAEV